MIEENLESLVPSQQSLARLESVTEEYRGEYRGEYREERYGDSSRGGAGNNDRGSNVSGMNSMNSMNSMNNMSSNISDNHQTKSDHPLNDPLAKQHPYNHS